MSLVHAFITTGIYHCSSVPVGLPLHGLNGRCDRVLRLPARLIDHLPKYASVSAYMHNNVHWLSVSQRIFYPLAALVLRCLLGCAPSYLSDLCRPVSDFAPRRAMRS
jgi:hypothetical protein